MFPILFIIRRYYKVMKYMNFLEDIECLCPPKNSYIELLIPGVAVFGDEVLKEIIKVK